MKIDLQNNVGIKMNHFSKLLLLMSVNFSFWGCTKEVESDVVVTDKFMHVYTDLGTQTCNFMKATDDGGCLLFVNEDLRAFGDGKKLAIIKLNEKGAIEWKNKIEDYELPSLSLCTELSDGSLLFTKDGNAGFLVKVSKTGTIDFVTDFNFFFPKENTYYGGYAQQCSNGEYRLAFCNGNATWDATAYVSIFNPDGTFRNAIKIPEAYFNIKNFKLLGISLYKYGNGFTHFFMGSCFLHDKYNISWAERTKLYVNKMMYRGDTAIETSRTVILDTIPDNNEYLSYFHKYTNDRHVIITTSYRDNQGVVHGRIFKVNDDLEIVWQTDVSVSNFATSLSQSIEFTKDGNIFVTGSCQVPGKISTQPFAAKVSKDGHVMWYKIFQTNLNSAMSYGLETNSGDYIFSGITTGFGAGNTGADLFIMKTDENLNYKE